MHARDLLPWNWHKGETREPTNTFFDDWFPAVESGEGWRRIGSATQAFLPALDVADEEREIVVTAELPGLEEKDFNVTLEGDMLAITGEKSSDRSESEEGGTWTERRYGSFERRIPLPCEIDANAARASFTKGVLKLRLPKVHPTPRRPKTRVIPIETEL
jgi:HSP20 family protein